MVRRERSFILNLRVHHPGVVRAHRQVAVAPGSPTLEGIVDVAMHFKAAVQIRVATMSLRVRVQTGPVCRQ